MLVRPAGLEPATCGFEARRSIQLSYGRTRAISSTPRKGLSSEGRGLPCLTRNEKGAPSSSNPLFSNLFFIRAVENGLDATSGPDRRRPHRRGRLRQRDASPGAWLR